MTHRDILCSKWNLKELVCTCWQGDDSQGTSWYLFSGVGRTVRVIVWQWWSEEQGGRTGSFHCRMVGSHFASGWFTHSRDKDTALGVSLTLTHKGKKWKCKSSSHLDSRPPTERTAPAASRAAQPQRRARALPACPAPLFCSSRADRCGLAADYCSFLWAAEGGHDLTPCQPSLTFWESFSDLWSTLTVTVIRLIDHECMIAPRSHNKSPETAVVAR